MNQTFFDESVKIADSFIKTIAIIDDKSDFDEIISNDPHEIEATTITKEFAKLGQSCTFFKMQSISEEETVLKLIENTDVCVLDWKLLIDQNQLPDENPEDIEDVESRGEYTEKLLQKVLDSKINSPKLITIYTGETGTDAIYDSIKRLLPENAFEENEDDLWFQTTNFRIKIFLKPLRGDSFHKHISTKSISYDELPKVISQEFAKLTGGLISNVALKSITALRENTSQLLQKFRKELDPAYLAHRAMLPIPEDAEDLLKDSIVQAIDSILSYEEVSQNCSIESIQKWLEQINDFSNNEVKINEANLNLDNAARIQWQKDGFESAFDQLWQRTQSGQTPKRKIQNKEKGFHKHAINYYLPKNVISANLDEEFAILTHHKSNFRQPNYVPHMTLGVVIKSSDNHFICILPRCDSVRIKNGISRKFLFLPLEKSDSNFSIIYKNDEENYIKLKVKNKKGYDLETFCFQQKTDKEVILATKEGEKFFFNDKDGNKFEWLLDLQEAHAQRIVKDFSDSLSRIGLDESEWLRRS